jgi:hypothetical protein
MCVKKKLIKKIERVRGEQHTKKRFGFERKNKIKHKVKL